MNKCGGAFDTDEIVDSVGREAHEPALSRQRAPYPLAWRATMAASVNASGRVNPQNKRRFLTNGGGRPQALERLIAVSPSVDARKTAMGSGQ